MMRITQFMQVMTKSTLKVQNWLFAGTRGVSCNNRAFGFIPGFLDRETGTVYISCNTDGSPAPIHLIDGLPEALVVARGSSGRVMAVKGSVIAGFIKDGHFSTREQAARVLAQVDNFFSH